MPDKIKQGEDGSDYESCLLNFSGEGDKYAICMASYKRHHEKNSNGDWIRKPGHSKDKNDSWLINGKMQKDLEAAPFFQMFKEDKSRNIVYGVVASPDEIDAHEEYMIKEDILDAMHEYMINYRNIKLSHGNIKTQSGTLCKDVKIVECYSAPCDFTAPDGQLVKEGSWVMGVKILSKEILKATQSGDFFIGFSIGGMKEIVED
jgi:hypothetical protein